VPHGSPFDLRTKITGPGNSYFQHISTESGCKIFLRGRGSVRSHLVLTFTTHVDLVVAEIVPLNTPIGVRQCLISRGMIAGLLLRTGYV